MEKKKNSLKIGILIEVTGSAFHCNILNGISRYADRHGLNLLCFAGGRLHSPSSFDNCKNTVYEFINNGNCDGLIIFSQMLGTHATRSQMMEFCKRYSGIPMVSVGMQLDNIPSIMIDNKRGMEESIRHLIDDHGYRRIALLRGPENVPDAEGRWQSYRDVLSACGIPIEKELIIEDQFSLSAGTNAIATLIDERGVKFDAFIANNDDAAIGAINALRLRNISVPEDVAVIGYDDIITSKVVEPPLTTVNQPIYEQGENACRMIHDLLLGRTVEPVQILTSKLVVRESCGCRLKNFTRMPGSSENKAVAAIKSDIREYIQDRLAPSHPFRDKWMLSLLLSILDSLFYAIMKDNSNPFFNLWKEFLSHAIEKNANKQDLTEILLVIRSRILPFINDKRRILNAEDIFLQARAMMGELYFGTELSSKIVLSYKEEQLQNISEALHIALNLKEQMDIIYLSFPSIDIPACFLSLFDNPEKPGQNSRMILAFDEKGRIDPANYGKSFPTPDLVPQRSLLSRTGKFTYVVQCLFYGEDRMGYILFKIDNWTGNINDMLVNRLSSSLKGSTLLKKIRDLVLNLEITANERTKDLAKTNAQLKLEVGKLQEILSGDAVLPVEDESMDFRIQKAINFMNRHFNKELTLQDVANKVFMGVTYFSKVFKQVVGKGFIEYLINMRIEKALELLKDPNLKISDVAHMVGYQDPNYFYKAVKKHSGLTPTEYRKKLGINDLI
ncbi:MAG: substrate-binding domain-containing protein [Spirochaetales bacterium]|nr:substrate-binding domain-containing protein [Spirochaetales bacterium]